jgi:hypothetical protein
MKILRRTRKTRTNFGQVGIEKSLENDCEELVVFIGIGTEYHSYKCAYSPKRLVVCGNNYGRT